MKIVVIGGTEFDLAYDGRERRLVTDRTMESDDERA